MIAYSLERQIPRIRFGEWNKQKIFDRIRRRRCNIERQLLVLANKHAIHHIRRAAFSHTAHYGD